jgi:hypothetical protein
VSKGKMNPEKQDDTQSKVTASAHESKLKRLLCRWFMDFVLAFCEISIYRNIKILGKFKGDRDHFGYGPNQMKSITCKFHFIYYVETRNGNHYYYNSLWIRIIINIIGPFRMLYYRLGAFDYETDEYSIFPSGPTAFRFGNS